MLEFFVPILLVVLLVAAVLIGVFFALYWRIVQRPVPILDGRVEFSRLDAPVEILRDKHGIPHIYAQNRADLFRAQGYVHAQDRMWQMEQNRRVGQGRLAEMYGDAALDADRFSRIVGFRRAAEADLAACAPDTREVLAWYAEGVNAYLAARPGRLAAELNLLRVTPEEWTPLDSLVYTKIISWGLSLNWESELTRLRLLERVGPIRAAELEPDYPTTNPVILEAVGSSEALKLMATAGLLLNEYEKVRPWVGMPAEGIGSNSWAVAPAHSASRQAMLCNDPHLAVQMPGIWYENHLSCPDLEVSGASFAGLPGVVLGHNEQIAWGMTNACCDVQDLYLERVDPADTTRFEYDGAYYQADVYDEVIQVRGRATPHVERVIVTRHGPLISAYLRGAGVAAGQEIAPLALRWVGHEQGTDFTALLRLNEARNWDEFQAALANWSDPCQNVTYADADGNIGYLLAGRIPCRQQNLGLLPSLGWLPDGEWQGWIPADELPRLYNPTSGRIVTANNKIAGDDYPHFLGVEFLPGWRANRIEELLLEKERFTPADMMEMQADLFSRFAARLAPWFAQVQSDDPFEKVAVGLLRRWDYRMEPESSAALVFQVAWMHLLDLMFGDKLGDAKSSYLGISLAPIFIVHGFMLRASTRLLELIETEDESIWYLDLATGQPRPREALLREALRRAVRQIRHDLGDNARRWNWGRMHQVRYTHPLGSARLFRRLFNRGPFPVGGDSMTVNLSGYAPQPTPGLVQVLPGYRQIFTAGAWDDAQSVVATGQSGHPLSDHYDDQITMWREGVYHPMPWSRAAVESAAHFRMTLDPAPR